MPEREGENTAAPVSQLEAKIGALVSRLQECRRENEMLKSELASLENILRTYKLPGGSGTSPDEDRGNLSAPVPYAEKQQMKQKLLLLLQKIEMELRNNQAV
ncbi:MAG: hypothetical protein RAO75_03520 [Candidatus Chlorobium antarcticum]|jgi:chaperonin cofactor prefoldin|nr:hypothetical protein [Candidatus Chlorobium antarcticum]